MGTLHLSRKSLIPCINDAGYWAERGMYDFMPSKAWYVPFSGEWDVDTHRQLTRKIEAIEQERWPYDQIGVHIERPSDAQYLIITIGCYAT